MKSRRLRYILLCVLFLVLFLAGAMAKDYFSQAGRSFAASQEQNDHEKDLEDRLSVIKIATWYTPDDLTYLRAYLARKFPDFEFEYVYLLFEEDNEDEFLHLFPFSILLKQAQEKNHPLIT